MRLRFKPLEGEAGESKVSSDARDGPKDGRKSFFEQRAFLLFFSLLYGRQPRVFWPFLIHLFFLVVIKNRNDHCPRYDIRRMYYFK